MFGTTRARQHTRRARAAIPAIVAIGALVWPGVAAAHSRAPTVALDFRFRLSPRTQTLSGVRVRIVDGDKGLRLTVDPAVTLIVLGDLGEPFVRFDSSGVWVNRASPTAAGARLVKHPVAVAGQAWTLATSGHTLGWHDHRLAPRAGAQRGAFSVPIRLGGRPAELAGSYVRVARPRWWLWLAAVLVVIAPVALAMRRLPAQRPWGAVALGMLAAAGALAANAGFASGGAISGAGTWIELPAVGILLVLAAGSLFLARPSTRVWIAAAIGGVAAATAIGGLGVFLHGVVISTLPAPAARLAVALAVTAGIGAALIAFFTRLDERPKPSPARRTR